MTIRNEPGNTQSASRRFCAGRMLLGGTAFSPARKRWVGFPKKGMSRLQPAAHVPTRFVWPKLLQASFNPAFA